MKPAEIRQARIDTAKAKILSVLRSHVACHQKELERRVCEVGFSFYPLAPPEQRPEPVHLTEARRLLQDEGRIRSISRGKSRNSYTFFYLSDGDWPSVEQVIDQKLKATEDVDHFHHDVKYSGHCAERLYWSALIEDPDTYAAYPYEAGRDYKAVNGRRSDRGVDLVAVHLPTRLRIVAEVKNIREWIYPDSPYLWGLLGAAAQLEAMPLLVARRVAEPTFLFLHDIGAFAHPTFHIFIDKEATSSPRWPDFERGCELLGYKDVKVVDPRVPTQAGRRLFQHLLPDSLPWMADRFRQFREDILALAKDQGLWGTSIARQHRDDIVRRFWAGLRSSPPPDF